MKEKHGLLYTYFGITAFETAAVFSWFFSERLSAEPDNILDVFTKKDIALLFLFAAVLVFLLFVLIRLLIEKNLPIRIALLFQKKDINFQARLGSGLLLLWSVQNLIYSWSSAFKSEIIFDYYQRLTDSLLSFFVWTAVLSAQTFLLLSFFQGGDKRKASRGWQLRNWLFPMGIVFLLWIPLVVLGFGFLPGASQIELRRQIGVFLPLAKPLPAAQVILLCGLGGILLLVRRFWEKLTDQRIYPFSRPIVVIPLLVTAAVLIWSAAPLEETYILTQTDIPSVQYMPNSDAFFFEKTAYQLLNGEGLENRVTHVFYPVFLTLLHALVGDNFLTLINSQFIILGFVPVFLYLIGRKLSSDTAGILAGLAFIIRERNGLLLGSELGGPLINQLQSEQLMLLFVTVLCYLLLTWTDDPNKNRFHSWIAGGLFGLMILTRVETSAVFFAVVFTVGITFWKKKKLLYQFVVSFTAITILTIFPWMVRNLQTTGVFAVDVGKRIWIREITRRYLGPAENPNSEDQKQLSVADGIPSQGYSRGTVMLHHFGNNLQQTFFYLPNQYQPFGWAATTIPETFQEDKPIWYPIFFYFSETFLDYQTRSLPYYWYEWDGTTSPRSYLPLFIVVVLIAAGGKAAYEKNKEWMMITVGFLVGYFLVLSFAGLSGSRYVKPYDWITLILFWIGLTTAFQEMGKKAGWDISFIPEEDCRSSSSAGNNLSRNRFQIGFQLSITGGVILLGWLAPLMEAAIQPRYTFQKLLSSSYGEELGFNDGISWEEEEGKAYLDDYEIYFGKALYPRFYQDGERLLEDRRKIPADVTNSRVDFYLVGMDNIGVSLPTDSAEDVFPHAREVIITARTRPGDYLEAECIYLLDSKTSSLNLRIGDCRY